MALTGLTTSRSACAEIKEKAEYFSISLPLLSPVRRSSVDCGLYGVRTHSKRHLQIRTDGGDDLSPDLDYHAEMHF